MWRRDRTLTEDRMIAEGEAVEKAVAEVVEPTPPQPPLLGPASGTVAAFLMESSD